MLSCRVVSDDPYKPPLRPEATDIRLDTAEDARDELCHARGLANDLTSGGGFCLARVD